MVFFNIRICQWSQEVHGALLDCSAIEVANWQSWANSCAGGGGGGGSKELRRWVCDLLLAGQGSWCLVHVVEEEQEQEQEAETAAKIALGWRFFVEIQSSFMSFGSLAQHLSELGLDWIFFWRWWSERSCCQMRMVSGLLHASKLDSYDCCMSGRWSFFIHVNDVHAETGSSMYVRR
jgi:hypothetical protein